MGSVVRYRNGWRAYVYINKKRKTKTFRLESEAKAWADASESKSSQTTFTAVTERFLALKLPKLSSAANQGVYEQSIRDHVLPAIGNRKLVEITRRDLVGVVRAIAVKGKVETAHRVGQRIRAIFDFAVDEGEIENPSGSGSLRVLPEPERRQMMAIPVGELPELMGAINRYPEPVTRIGLLLLAHTFVRTAELIGAEWKEIKGDVWVIPEERMKRKLPHVIPLSSHVRKLLAQVESMTGDSPYILVSPINPRVPISNNTLLFAPYRLGYRKRMTGHGFRAIASSILNESGLWSHDAIERQLSHKETDRVREAYHRAAYLPERTKMMAWYSKHLASL